MTVSQLSPEDNAFLKRKIRHSTYAALILNTISLFACMIWSLSSGYWQPFAIWAGFAAFVSTLWLYTNKTKKQELKKNQKNIYTGIIKKYREYVGLAENENERIGIIIDKEPIDSIELHAFFCDGDEGEVHISENRKFLYSKKILNKSGTQLKVDSNSEKNFQQTASRLIKKESQAQIPLTLEESTILKSKYKKRLKIFLIVFFSICICLAVFIEFFALGIMSLYDRSYFQIFSWSFLGVLFLMIYWGSIHRVKKDILSKTKTVLETVIQDKETVYYKGSKIYYIKTLKKRYELDSSGYHLFQNSEEIKMHFTKHRKKLIQIESTQDKNKLYKEPKFFQ